MSIIIIYIHDRAIHRYRIYMSIVIILNNCGYVQLPRVLHRLHSIHKAEPRDSYQ